MAEERLDAFLVTHGHNRRYLSGFTGSAGALFITPQEALLHTDFRYWIQAAGQALEFELMKHKDPLKEEIGGILNERLKVRRVGFEAQAVTVQTLRELVEAVPEVEWVPASSWVEELRAVKDRAELELIRQAARLTDEALDHARSRLRPGQTEAEVAWMIETYIRQHGGEAVAFDIIVASGPNAALAHYRPADRALRSGEPILIDLGARIGGYCADLTRTLILAELDGRFDEIYAIVHEAQARCLAGTRAGLSGKDCDALTREPITDAGYGEAFGHGTGHGVGLEVHEKPQASKRSEDTLQAGNTLTIEPGIYLEGWGGVRLEDLVVITPQGVENLSGASKDPMVV